MHPTGAGIPLEPLRLTVEERADAMVISLAGEVDNLTEAELRAAVRDATSHLQGRVLVLDLSEVTFFGSPGLAILARAADDVRRDGGDTAVQVVTGGTRIVRRAVEITGLDAVLELRGSLEEALGNRGR